MPFRHSPRSRDVAASEYPERLAAVAPSNESGFSGIVVDADSGLVDLWLVFQLIVESMERLSPLVAVQPISIHPHSAAKMVASLGYRTVGRLHLNIVELEERELCDEHRRREVKPPCAASVAR
jgi:alkanesulfonate monooxygenase